jgi:hypothetical protein
MERRVSLLCLNKSNYHYCSTSTKVHESDQRRERKKGGGSREGYDIDGRGSVGRNRKRNKEQGKTSKEYYRRKIRLNK